MSTIEHSTPEHPSHSDFADMSHNLMEIIDRHVSQLPCPIFELDTEDQQKLSDKITPYLQFEFSQYESLKGAPIVIGGDGMFIACDAEGNIVGVETIADGDLLDGVIDDVCAYPVPTDRCLADAEGSSVRVYDQTMSAVLMLEQATFKTGLLKTGEFSAEHDLGHLYIGVPLTKKISSKI